MNIGYDGGFYAAKAISGDRTSYRLSFASGRFDTSMLSLNGHSSVIVASDQYGRYLVGEEAVKLAPIEARKESRDWIDTSEYMNVFYAGVSDLTTASQVTVNLVTGLPVADYRQDWRKLCNRFLGVHRFTREGPDRTAQIVKIESVRVLPQAWGAILCLLLDNKGVVVQPELAEQKTGVIDAGGHTVNYLSVNGLSDIPAETRGTERGAWNVVRNVRNFFAAEYPGLNRLTDHDIMDAIIKGIVYDGDKPIDLGPVVKPIIDDIGQEIVDTARQYWGAHAATFRRIVMIGGGAYLWGEHVKRAFEQTITLPHPELANARGFYRFAVNKANQAKQGA